jgi:hypothetical protein
MASPSPAPGGASPPPRRLPRWVIVVAPSVAIIVAVVGYRTERPAPALPQVDPIVAPPANQLQPVRTRWVRCPAEGEIAPEAALAGAREVLGPDVRVAEAFRWGGGALSLAVLLSSSRVGEDGSTYEVDTVVVLRCGGRHWSQHGTPLSPRGIPAGSAVSRFGVLDVDGDGSGEVFAVSTAYGTAGYAVEVALYDPADSATYTYQLAGPYANPAAPRIEAETSPNLREKRGARAWMDALARPLAEAAAEQENPYDGEGYRRRSGSEDVWAATYGRGYVDGPVGPRRLPGNVPGAERAHCAVDDGRHEWSTFFRGALWGYDREDHAHFVVYVPPDRYEWVPSLVAGRRYLWTNTRSLGPDGRAGLLAYDKEESRLLTVPIPEVTALQPCPSGTCNLGLRLTARNGGLYLENTGRLTLPSFIAADELARARPCVERPAERTPEPAR